MLKPKFWNKKNSLIGFFLIPFSYFLQLLFLLQKKITKQKYSSIPVICVGNIYLGGTGKTPLAIEIIKILEKSNKKVALVKKSYTNHLDEFKLIQSKGVTLFKALSREVAIKNAVKDGFEYVVLDDGFQDFSINKNLNIVCFNEKQLDGNGMTLPSGPLREPISSLRRCQIVVINGSQNLEFEKKMQLKPHIVYLANSSNVKVGVTRKSQVPTRWIDQGAHEAIEIVEVPNRYLAGITEVALKEHVSDKTNWRKMLTSNNEDIDLLKHKELLAQYIPEEAKEYYLKSNTDEFKINFPVIQFPDKVKSLNLIKTATYTGVLKGIKGQYLMFQDSIVFNVRANEGLVVSIEV